MPFTMNAHEYIDWKYWPHHLTDLPRQYLYLWQINKDYKNKQACEMCNFECNDQRIIGYSELS